MDNRASIQLASVTSLFSLLTIQRGNFVVALEKMRRRNGAIPHASFRHGSRISRARAFFRSRGKSFPVRLSYFAAPTVAQRGSLGVQTRPNDEAVISHARMFVSTRIATAMHLHSTRMRDRLDDGPLSQDTRTHHHGIEITQANVIKAAMHGYCATK